MDVRGAGYDSEAGTGGAGGKGGVRERQEAVEGKQEMQSGSLDPFHLPLYRSLHVVILNPFTVRSEKTTENFCKLQKNPTRGSGLLAEL